MYVVVKFVNKEPIMEQFETFETLQNRHPDSLSALTCNTEEEAHKFLEDWRKEYNELRKGKDQGPVC